MTSSIPWQQRLSTGTEDIQDEVIRWYQQTRHGKSYVPEMIWGTLQTEAYAAVILGRVVAFLGVPDDVPAGWRSGWSANRSCTTASTTTT